MLSCCAAAPFNECLAGAAEELSNLGFAESGLGRFFAGVLLLGA